MCPLELIRDSISKSVRVHTSVKSVYSGTLLGFDIYVNIVLADARIQDAEEPSEKLVSECLINGQNVTFVEIL